MYRREVSLTHAEIELDDIQEFIVEWNLEPTNVQIDTKLPYNIAGNTVRYVEILYSVIDTILEPISINTNLPAIVAAQSGDANNRLVTETQAPTGGSNTDSSTTTDILISKREKQALASLQSALPKELTRE